MVKITDLVLYKESQMEIDNHLAQLIHKNPTRENKDRFHAAIITYVWSESEVDLFVFFSYGYGLSKKAVKKTSDLFSNKNGWLFSSEISNEVF